MKTYYLFFTVSLILFCSQTQAKKLSIAAIDWCPQICPESNEKGYVIDLVENIYKNTAIELEIKYYPWSRAIKLVREGKVDALLSPAKAEAPDLIYPQNEVGIQRMCFFTSKNSTWNFSGEASLKGQQVGISQDTSVEELNDYVKAHPDQFQFQPYLDRYIKQSIGKLDKGRIDSFLFTLATTKYELTKLGVWQNYRNAGCVSKANIYMAFSPNMPSLRRDLAIELFDKNIELLHRQHSVDTILGNYGLTTWR